MIKRCGQITKRILPINDRFHFRLIDCTDKPFQSKSMHRTDTLNFYTFKQ